MTNDECKAMSLWRQIVFAEGGNKCAMSNSDGKCAGPLVAHHIAGRGNGLTFNADLGLLLCTKNHMESQFAPHMNKRRFLFWLELHYPAKHKLYMELKDKRVPKRDINIKTIITELEKRLDDVMCKVA